MLRKFSGTALQRHVAVITKGPWTGRIMEIEQVYANGAVRGSFLEQGGPTLADTPLIISWKYPKTHIEIIDSLRDQPEFWLVRIADDMSLVNFTSAAARKHVKQLYSVYLFDRNTKWHLCESTASYSLVFVGYSYDWYNEVGDSEREEIEEELRDMACFEEDTYEHCYQVEEAIKRCPVGGKFLYIGNGMDFGFDFETARSYDSKHYVDCVEDAVESCREHVCGNGYVDFGTRQFAGRVCTHCGKGFSEEPRQISINSADVEVCDQCYETLMDPSPVSGGQNG